MVIQTKRDAAFILADAAGDKSFFLEVMIL